MSRGQKIGVMIGVAALALFVYALKPILAPFLLGMLLAYLFHPLVDFLVRIKLPRVLAIIGVFVLLIVLIFAVVLLIFPILEQQLMVFYNNVPAILTWVQNTALPWIRDTFHVQAKFDLDFLRSIVTGDLQRTSNIAGIIWQTVSSSGIALLIGVVNMLLASVVLFYMLRDWDGFVGNLRTLLPRRYEKTTVNLVIQCNQVVGAFFRGQLMIMLSLGVIYAFSLGVVGLDLGLLIGFLAGVISIVPYLGTIIGVLLASLAALTQFGDMTHLLLVWMVFLVGNLLEGMVLTPVLVGDSIGLHPVVVIFAVLAGGELFGFVGVLLALPVAASISVLIRHFYGKYLKSAAYKKIKREA